MDSPVPPIDPLGYPKQLWEQIDSRLASAGGLEFYEQPVFLEGRQQPSGGLRVDV